MVTIDNETTASSSSDEGTLATMAYPSDIRKDYKVESIVGKGSFATVRKGRSRETGERVAIKVISKRRLSDADKLNLKNEIEVMKQVDHPNIVKLYDVYEDEKYFFLVMELCKGGELYEKIVEREQFSEAEARNTISPIFDAVIYCHELGIVHRDIKPENMLYTSRSLNRGIIKVSDFGLARFVGEENLA